MKLNRNTLTSFRIEELRQELVQKGDFSGFKKTYLGKFPEIKDLNKKQFWNTRMLTDRSLLKSNHIYQDKIRIVCRYLQTKKGKLLDIGFGWGILEKKIENYSNLDVSGIDISTEAVNYANKNLKGQFITASIFKIPFKNNEFDVIVALDIIEHIRPTMVFNAYKEILRVLKKDGIFIVTMPINEGLEEMVMKGSNPVSHLRAYTPDVIKTELDLSGFIVLKTEFRYAFKKFYKLKNLIMKFGFTNLRHPNLMIISSIKK